MIGAIVAGVFFAVLTIAILSLVVVVRYLSVKYLNEAYRMYLLENGYKQPEKEVIERYYNQRVKSIKK